ncbi:hypothetical protein C5E07_13070 [Pseudoclavibacter sp. RFBJ3]|nr:hypothetical protein C5C12_12145 [Pseudoclavibacter sp. RFBJ5]PPF91516.1 hypothetical protein C5E07_13070 [Pseudoclavibacter sp. RFBJ3]PPF96439.1 hypothetical protein C5C19_15760 [Pseudoclavibacter sp. RFBH5]PPG22184.1 hypothetical protein C5E13_12395 [Pseudoclavibacter sp. RFBI4]
MERLQTSLAARQSGAYTRIRGGYRSLDPDGFESPILGHVHESPDQGFQVGAFVMLQAGRADGQARVREREEGATRR